MLHLGLMLGGHAASDENAPGGEEVQRDVPGFSPIDANEDRHGLIANRSLALLRQLRDESWSIRRRRDPIFQPLRLLRFLSIAKKVVDVLDSRPGKKPLVADAAVFLLEIRQQLHFQGVSGCEIGVPALAGEGRMPESSPINARQTKAGPRRDDRSSSLPIRRACITRTEIS